MSSESMPPTPSGGGGAKYAVVGVVLFAIAGLVWCATQDGGPPVATGPTELDAGTTERSTALVDSDLDIPELEPDAGPPPDSGQAVVAEVTRPRTEARSWDSCTGELEAAAARRVMQEHNAQIRNCYERQLKQNPQLEGTMSLSLRVGSDGRVDGTQVSGTLRDRDVFSCVRNVASSMRFPPPGGRDCALVQVPFSFSPRR